MKTEHGQSNSKITRGVSPLYTVIRRLVLSARQAVVHRVNTLQVATYYQIGQSIVEHEQRGKSRAAYGQQVLKELAERLTAEFGKGFSITNLKLMRQFYLSRQPAIGRTSSDAVTQKGQTVSDFLRQSETAGFLLPAAFTLSWSHYVFLMGIKDPQEQRFYEAEATQQGWSLRELKRQFDASLYERLALSRDKESFRMLAEKGHLVEKPQDLLKEPYVLEFLGIDERTKYSETELETAIIDKIESFLLELGKGFLFEARQKRFTFGEDHFFIDLVFYNRLLRCYVLIDLKIGKLTHQDLGQMQMYVNYFDQHVKARDEHSTVGIILCKKKHDALVEITLPKGANIHARQYQLYLPDKEQLRQKLIEWQAEAESEEIK